MEKRPFKLQFIDDGAGVFTVSGETPMRVISDLMHLVQRKYYPKHTE